MTRKHKIFFASCMLFLVAAGPNDETRPAVPVKKHVLPNGLTVLVSEMPESPVITVDMFVKTGSANEGELLGTGITHFLEHMLFKGTERRGVGQIPQEVQSLGGIINASTGKDHTFFTITVPSKDFRKGCEILADMLQHPRMDSKEIDKEKEVVISEMRLHRDRPEYYLSDLVFRNAYKVHPYGVPIIGFEQLLRKLTREDFVRYYRAKYVPNNMILSIAGGIRDADALAAARQYFENFPRGIEVVVNLPQEPQRLSPRRYEEEYPTELARLSLAFSGVSMRDPDMYALDALAMILGEGEESRLQRALFQKKSLVRQIFASNFTPFERGIFEIEATSDDKHVTAVISGVKEQIELLQEKGITEAELTRVKAKITSEYINELQTSDDVAYSVAANEAALGDPDFYRRYVDAVERLTPADIRRVARQYLPWEQVSLVILRPKKEDLPDSRLPQDPYRESVPEMTTLSNGLRVVIREDHRLPIVSMNVALYGGTRVESEPIMGLSFLTAQLWVKGTRHKTPDKLVRDLEARGARLSAFSGESSFGIHFDFLSKDTPYAIDLLAELIKSPRFDDEAFLDIKQNMRTGVQERKDSIFRSAWLRLREILFSRHPVRWDPVGSLESIERFSLADSKDFYHQWVAPNNMVLTIFGDVNKDQVLAAVKSRLGDLSQKPVDVPKFSQPELTQTVASTMRMDKKQAMVLVGLHAVNKYDRDRYAFEILNTILNSPFSGRVFNMIRDQFGQSYTLGGDYVPLIDDGLIYFYVLTSSDNVEAAKDALLRIIRTTREKGILFEELRDAKEYLKGTEVMALQTNSQMANRCMLDELYGLGCEDYKKFSDLIDRTPKEDVERVARKFLDLSHAVILVVNPRETTP